MANRWFVARTEPRAEFLAADELARDGFEIFFPHINARHLRHGESEVPLFPGYMFIRWDTETAGWPAFRPGHRLAGWVKFDDEVPSIPDEVVAELVGRWDEIKEAGGLWRRFQHGQKVRVVSGALESLAEVLEAPKSPQGRVRILMEFMGRMISAQVDPQDLQALESEPFESNRAPRRTRGRGRWINGFGSRVSTTA
ncbi:hypothetical protein FIM07_04945 [SAR202 cluster bacterium AD-802-F09_MRT_200m]|nr:hypothetical protein [SAR202 cluster bacterium AD-802-F09_MRT_200m]